MQALTFKLIKTLLPKELIFLNSDEYDKCIIFFVDYVDFDIIDVSEIYFVENLTIIDRIKFNLFLKEWKKFIKKTKKKYQNLLFFE